MTDRLGYEIHLQATLEDALEQLKNALKSEGFGVLTSIDVRTTMKEKLNEDFRPYHILGACNPPLAHRALTADPEIGLLLPCNVTIEEISAGNILIRLIDPLKMMSIGIGDDPTLNQVAQDAAARMANVAVALQALPE
ncbi:MAG: DUF302 domain-containing protein [Anaerolineales bacterium]|jgi:uncharacterized protein (DUF302 family)